MERADAEEGREEKTVLLPSLPSSIPAYGYTPSEAQRSKVEEGRRAQCCEVATTVSRCCSVDETECRLVLQLFFEVWRRRRHRTWPWEFKLMKLLLGEDGRGLCNWDCAMKAAAETCDSRSADEGMSPCRSRRSWVRAGPGSPILLFGIAKRSSRYLRRISACVHTKIHHVGKKEGNSNACPEG